MLTLKLLLYYECSLVGMDDFVGYEILMIYICTKRRKLIKLQNLSNSHMSVWAMRGGRTSTYLIKLSVSLYIVNAAFSVHASRSIAVLVSRKYRTASKYSIA